MPLKKGYGSSKGDVQKGDDSRKVAKTTKNEGKGTSEKNVGKNVG